MSEHRLQELLNKRENLEHLQQQLQKKIDQQELLAVQQQIQELDHLIDELEIATPSASPEQAAPMPSDPLSVFSTYLKEATEIDMKRRGVIAFLFSRHPKVLLGEKIAYAAREARELLSQELPLEIKAFLEKFLIECDKPWNNALYEGKMADLYREFTQLYS